MELGNLIKKRRLELGLTQSQLAKGICTQALISRIENNDTLPKKDILEKFEKRLKLEHNELNIYVTLKSNQHKINDVIHEMRDSLDRRDYKSIEILLNYNHDVIESSKDINDTAFFKWMEASVAHQLYDESEEALDILCAIPVDKLQSELSIEIVNATGLIYYQKKDYKKAITIFYSGMQTIDDDVDFKIHAKLLFNYALTLEESDQLREALSILISGTELLLENDSLYLLGDFYYTKAFIYDTMNNYDEALNNLEYAKVIFKLQNNTRFYDYTMFSMSNIKKAIKQLEE